MAAGVDARARQPTGDCHKRDKAGAATTAKKATLRAAETAATASPKRANQQNAIRTLEPGQVASLQQRRHDEGAQASPEREVLRRSGIWYS